MNLNPPITKAEVKFLELYATGYTSTQIATLCHISPHTARTHMKNIRPKLQTPTINAAVSLAHQQNISPRRVSAPGLCE
jgi:DNA-binding CsgD family transcriptional regulator